MAPILSCFWLVITTWLIIRAADQRGVFRAVDPMPVSPAETAPKVAVIVPARNEESNIGPCLRCLIQQTYPAQRLTILVIDDCSSDATALMAEAEIQAHSHVRIIAGLQPPQRWVGKSFACWTGATQVPPDTEWLCFLDADTRAEPALIASAIVTASDESLDLLSLAPRQNMVSFAERLVLPCGLYFLGFSQNLAKLQSPRSGGVTATGQFMLVRSCTYRAVGGHAAVPFAICEDIALAGLVKQRGGRVKLYDGQRLISTRMYTGWETLWPGIAKNLVDMLGGPLATVVSAFVAVMLAWAVWVIPILSAVSCARENPGACWSLLPALAGSASAIGLHLAGAVHFRIPLWYGVLFPFGYIVGAAIAIDSIWRRFRGRVTWKGRVYS